MRDTTVFLLSHLIASNNEEVIGMTKTQCRVCLSRNKESYEEMIRQGLSFMNISKIALEQYDEEISKDSLWRHSKNHIDYGRIHEVKPLIETPTSWKFAVHHDKRGNKHSFALERLIDEDHPLSREYDDTTNKWHKMLSKKSEH